MREAQVKKAILLAYKAVNGPETPAQRLKRSREKPAQTYARQEKALQKCIDGLERALFELGVPPGEW